MSLIDEALKQARLDAARQAAARQSSLAGGPGPAGADPADPRGGFASPWAHTSGFRRGNLELLRRREMAIGAAVVLALLIAGAGIWLVVRSVSRPAAVAAAAAGDLAPGQPAAPGVDAAPGTSPGPGAEPATEAGGAAATAGAADAAGAIGGAGAAERRLSGERAAPGAGEALAAARAGLAAEQVGTARGGAPLVPPAGAGPARAGAAGTAATAARPDALERSAAVGRLPAGESRPFIEGGAGTGGGSGVANPGRDRSASVAPSNGRGDRSAAFAGRAKAPGVWGVRSASGAATSVGLRTAGSAMSGLAVASGGAPPSTAAGGGAMASQPAQSAAPSQAYSAGATAPPVARSIPGGAGGAPPAGSTRSGAAPRTPPAPGSVPTMVDGGSYSGEVKLPDGSAIKLSGIAYSAVSPAAVINGKVLGPGQGFDQVTVDKIEPGKVTMRHRSGAVFYLRP